MLPFVFLVDWFSSVYAAFNLESDIMYLITCNYFSSFNGGKMETFTNIRS
jgi:hypothetical protein